MTLNEKVATEEVEGWVSGFLDKVEGEEVQNLHGANFESAAPQQHNLDQETPFQRLAEEIVIAPDLDADVAWGPKKMIDFLRHVWSPDSEDEDERFENDEEECSGMVREEQSESAALVTHQVSPTEDEGDVTQHSEAPAHAAPRRPAPVSKKRHRAAAHPGTAPKSQPDTQAAAEEGTQQVILTVADNSKVAEVREFFEDSRIHHRNNRTDEGEVFMFAGSAADEKKLLAFVANMLGVRGPVKLEITLSPPDEA